MGNVILLSTMRAICDCEPLPVGQVVSYGDAANLRSEAAVVNGDFGHHGQRSIWLDGRGVCDVTRNIIDGPGGWELVDRVLTSPEVAALVELRAACAKEEQQKREAAEEERRTREVAGKEWLSLWRPTWAKAVIVADLEQNQSDMMTDYCGSKTVQTVLLAWSKHTRDLFAEMRKAAARYEPTRHLADGPADWEHREKWSMGAGYYLAKEHRYSGWQVSKMKLASYNESQLVALAGNPAARALLEGRQ